MLPQDAGRISNRVFPRSDWGGIPTGITQNVFQSALPVRGATGRGRKSRPGAAISIHAPRVGSDLQFGGISLANAPISIHVPHVGSDKSGRFFMQGQRTAGSAPRGAGTKFCSLPHSRSMEALFSVRQRPAKGLCVQETGVHQAGVEHAGKEYPFRLWFAYNIAHEESHKQYNSKGRPYFLCAGREKAPRQTAGPGCRHR